MSPHTSTYVPTPSPMSHTPPPMTSDTHETHFDRWIAKFNKTKSKIVVNYDILFSMPSYGNYYSYCIYQNLETPLFQYDYHNTSIKDYSVHFNKCLNELKLEYQNEIYRNMDLSNNEIRKEKALTEMIAYLIDRSFRINFKHYHKTWKELFECKLDRITSIVSTNPVSP